MAAGNYTATPIIDISEALGRNENSEMLSEFQHQAKGNLETLRLISDNSELCYPNAPLRASFDKKLTEGQKVYIDVNQTVAPGTGAQSVRIGSGGNTRVKVEIVGQAVIEEGFEISSVNEAMSRFESYDIDERVRFTMMYLTAQKMKNIMVRAEKQAQAWLDSIKWASGGVGSIFAASGNYKTIPAGEDEKLFAKLNQEAVENKIKWGNSPYNILISDSMIYDIDLTQAYGQQNSAFFSESLKSFDRYIATELDAPDTNTQSGVLYTVAKGGVGMIGKAYKFSDSMLKAGNDTWENLAMPALPMFEGINTDLFEIRAKGFEGWVDNFSTYATDSSRIDFVKAMSFVTTMHFFSAYSGAARKPVVGYVKLKA